MGRFKFRMQKLLDIRIDLEEQSKLNFKEAMRQKSIVEDKLNNLKNNYEKYNVSTPHKSVIEQKIKLNYLNALNQSIKNTTIELNDKVEIVNEKREDLKQKQIDRKTVEILKDKQYKDFVLDENLKEQKSNDEFALYGYIRNRERR